MGIFFFFLQNVAARNEEEDRATALLSYLDGNAFEFVFQNFTKDVLITNDGSYYEKFKAALVSEFKIEDDPQEVIRTAMVATLNPGNLTSSMQAIDAIFSKA